MAPKKPSKPNGFFMFAMEFKNRQGRNFANTKEACDAAAPHWNRMTREERRPYDERAKLEKSGMGSSRYTSEGYDVDLLTKLEMDEQSKTEKMKEYIYQHIKKLKVQQALSEEMFFLIHINIFCYCQNEAMYYPAEIGVIAFNLMEGVKPANIFHFMIKPGAIPLGYSFEAKQHSDETHQIRPPMAGDKEDNTEEVFDNLVQFLSKKGDGSKKLPVLYADEKYQKVIETILDSWAFKYMNETDMFRVYNLQYMFRNLRNAAADENVWHSDTFSSREIEKDVNAYVTYIACSYHELSPVPLYCSKSIATRYAFVICDNCCPSLNIDLIPGQHVPLDSTIPDMDGSKASSVASFSTNSSSKRNRSRRRFADDDSASIGFSMSETWDTRSITSEVSSVSTTVNTEDNFPSLRPRANRVATPNSYTGFTPDDVSSNFSKSSVKSYAGATGKSGAGLSSRPAALPSAFERNMGSLSLSDHSEPTGAAGMGQFQNKKSEDDDFPALGRGRGFVPGRGRGLRRPNQGR